MSVVFDLKDLDDKISKKIVKALTFHPSVPQFQKFQKYQACQEPILMYYTKEGKTRLPFQFSCIYFKKRFNQDYKLKDVYLNAHEPLRNGSFHIDDNADRTVILYITPWEPAWGGFTHFIRSDKDHSVIAPVLGRLVNFQSKLVHKAYAYCNSICPIRITAAFKLKL